VTRARVTVDGDEVGAIGAGLLALVGAERGDTEADILYVADKIAGMRVWEREDGTTVDVAQAGGAVLVVSQFTLLAQMRRGRRPDFIRAAGRDEAQPAVEALVARIRWHGLAVSTGSFGAYMQVESVNDGPYTLLLDSRAERAPSAPPTREGDR